MSEETRRAREAREMREARTRLADKIEAEEAELRQLDRDFGGRLSRARAAAGSKKTIAYKFQAVEGRWVITAVTEADLTPKV